MSVARIGPTSERSYNPVVATGECSLCATKESSLYRLHRRSYGEVYDSAKHGPLEVESGRLGFKISTPTEEIVDEGGTEKTVTIAKTIFQRVGTDPETDDRVRLFTDDHASCADCIRRMILASQSLKCPFCRIPISKDTIHLPPKPQAAAAPRSSAPRAAGGGSSSSGAQRGSTAEAAPRAESRRSDGRSYLDAAASAPIEEARGSRRGHRPPRHATASSQGQTSLNEDQELEALLSATGARPGRHRQAGRHSHPTYSTSRADLSFQQMARALGEDDDEAVEATPHDSAQKRVDFSGMDPASIQLIKELMRQNGLSNRQLLEMQRMALPSNPRTGGSIAAAGSGAGEYLDRDEWQFAPVGGNHRPSGSRSAPSMMGSEAVAAPAPAAAARHPILIPGLSLPLSSHPLITFIVTGPETSALLDEAFATSLIANEEKVRFLLSKEIPLTVIHECREWIFSHYFTFKPTEAILSQMAVSERHETTSPLAKLYKQTVAYARFAPLGEDGDKLHMEEEIRETLSSLSEDDRNLVEEWIWRENGEPPTLDQQWGKNNPFYSAIGLYAGVYKAVLMKLLILSTAERIALISRCEGETTNICKLADSFI
jgi:hypothetical protein